MEGQGRAVVMLHSSMSSKNQWRALMQSLQGRYRVIAIDLLGYGDSEPHGRDADYRLAEEVRHVERILGKLLLPNEPYHLVGHSYGAAVALCLARCSERQLASLTCYEPVATWLLPPNDPARVEFEQLGKEVWQCAAVGDARGGAARFIDYWSGEGSYAALPETKQRLFANQLPKVMLEFRAIALERRVTAWLRDITAPVCLMFGRNSPMAPRRIVAQLATQIAHADCVEVSAGHMGPMTHPDLVNPGIVQFIARAQQQVRTPVALPAQESAPDGIHEVLRPMKASGFWANAFVIGLAGLSCAWPATRSAASGLCDSEAGFPAHPVDAGDWREFPRGLPHGGRYAVVSGNPAAAGGFVLQVELEPGFELPPRRAERELQMIVLSGELTVGRGSIEHPAAFHDLGTGCFALFGAHESYFARSQRGATVQIFGMGPLQWSAS